MGCFFGLADLHLYVIERMTRMRGQTSITLSLIVTIAEVAAVRLFFYYRNSWVTQPMAPSGAYTSMYISAYAFPPFYEYEFIDVSLCLHSQ